MLVLRHACSDSLAAMDTTFETVCPQPSSPDDIDCITIRFGAAAFSGEGFTANQREKIDDNRSPE